MSCVTLESESTIFTYGSVKGIYSVIYVLVHLEEFHHSYLKTDWHFNVLMLFLINYYNEIIYYLYFKNSYGTL